ncbi:MAG: hypothetical protein LBC93_00580 [Synergistaceae bacterium]|nr:hypothetical protein [Synergistaceae bacterium]
MSALKRLLLTVLLCTLFPVSAWANDSAEAFMSVTFGLSAARAQKRMEQSGATASGYVREGQLSMKGSFEYRPAIFGFRFHAKKGLNHKAVYIASTGNPQEDRALYDAFREACNIQFGVVEERAAPDPRDKKGGLVLRSTWKPNKDTVISLSYNPALTNRVPNDSPASRPIHLIYNYTKWTTQ